MSNLIRSATEFAINIVSQYVSSSDTVVDATCGNGHDTLALASLHPSQLYGFDIQPEAIKNTAGLLAAHGFSENGSSPCIHLICESHSHMQQYITEPVSVVMFNLGYLPGGDKNIVTSSSSTLTAVKAALGLIKKDGIICITMYDGHPEGAEEKKLLSEFAAGLDSSVYHCAYIKMINQHNTPPELLLITKKK